MKRSMIFLLAAFFSSISFSKAETIATVDQFIDGVLSISQKQCSNRGDLEKDYEAQGKIAAAHSVRTAEKMICECIPERYRDLKSSLTTIERQMTISESTFKTKYLPGIITPCVAEQFRSTYAEGCSDRLKQFRANTAKYCSCMARSVSALADEEMAQMANESADYWPLAADAKKRGFPIPEQPPAMRQFLSIESSCAKE